MEIEKKCPLYLYPIYFDASKTVSEGRRVPKSLAKSNPQPKDILAALTQQFGLAAELEKDKSHPKSIVGSGRIKVFNYTDSKNELLLKIATVLPSTSVKTTNNNNTSTNNNSTSSLNSSNSVQVAPNLVYQVRSKKKKNQK